MVSDYPIEFIELALKEAVLNKALSLKYIDKILQNWKKNNLKSVVDVQSYIEKFKNQKETVEERSYYKNLDE